MGCIFCDITAGRVGSDILYRDDQVVAFRDINPQAPVHILVIPVVHYDNLEAVSSDEKLITALLDRCARLGQEHCGAAGYRVVVNTGSDGGQTVDHLHFHVLGGRPMQWPPG